MTIRSGPYCGVLHCHVVIPPNRSRVASNLFFGHVLSTLWVVRQTYVTKIRIALFGYPLAVSIDSQRYRGTLERPRQSKQTKEYQHSGYCVHRETQMKSHRFSNTYFYFETDARDENIFQDLRRRSERQSSCS